MKYLYSSFYSGGVLSIIETKCLKRPKYVTKNCKLQVFSLVKIASL